MMKYLKRQNRKSCIEKCKAWTVKYWQRFCFNEHIKLWCYPYQYLKIIKAQYGNIPCRPSNYEYHGTQTCGPADAKILAHTKHYCDYQNKCYGYANGMLMAKSYLFYHSCGYKKPSFYVKYACKAKKSFCWSFCTCKKSYGDQYCKKNYHKY
ncbi:uncharacterized protein LOC127722454 isoform X2 [Mytilus californianus]|uniref:uncharacterized protein LOC127722454 isoform X2 n=1 Tax=Mytilus californianus TaxID=6549 RepID=UPI002247904F|nr:uncharacterized protein LOC127722454 isoform X2 [Mytilus californianus]